MSSKVKSKVESHVLDRTFRRAGRVRMTLAVVLCGVVAATTATSGVQAAPQKPSPGAPLRSQAEPLNKHGREVKGVPLKEPAYDSTPPPAPVWPAAGTATVTLGQPAAKATSVAGLRASAVKAGSLPVRVAGRRPAALTVEVLDRAAVPATWRDGLVVKLRPQTAPVPRAGVAPTPVPAEVSVDYGSFRSAKGGDWASRLTLWQLPACALATPEMAGCAPVALPSQNDGSAGRVTASVQIAAASAGTTFALAAAASGSAGTFAATPLAESSSWSVSGDFNWSYPMRVPPAAGGLEPDVGLSYSSGSVDGRSVATNNQPSWIGEGFEYSPGFIERKYIGCLDDMTGGTNKEKTGDQCWRSYNATLSLGGRSTDLIRDPNGIWHGRSEDGSVIRSLAKAGTNEDDNGEYWELTATDGTRYYFGLNKLPGQSAVTGSTWTTRVYGNQAIEPCSKDTFATSFCDQAWRWNLDYVIDVRGNTMSYWYNKETNQYAANKKNTELAPYVRGGSLARIDYGTWERGTGTGTTVTPRNQVVFGLADRCRATCATHNATTWPDTPWDLECAATAKTCKNFSPSYWSTKRLASVTTRVWDTTKATPAWQDVDAWTLTPAFPSTQDGTHPGLWLSSLVHTGKVGTAKAMPPITFSATPMVNRVLTNSNTTSAWQRIGSITSETGAKTVVTYSLPECTDTNTKGLASQNNTMRCYLVKASNPADPAEPDISEWWHKYVVTQVAQVDTELAGSLQAPIINTHYAYGGTPAWHYADDDGFVKPGRKTWSVFRGYDTVTTRVGETSGPQTLTVTKYLRGMHGDRNGVTATSTRQVTVGATLGDETVYDEDQFAGTVREQTVYNGSDTRPVSKTINVPWRSPPKASRTINGALAEARYVNTQATYSATALGVNGSRGWRTTRSVSTFDDDDGTVKKTQYDGEFDKPGDEQCVDHKYRSNAAKNLIGLPSVVTTTALPCGAPATTPDHVISAQRLFYDGSDDAADKPLVHGAVTRTDRLKNWTQAGGAEFQTIGSATYDAFGRLSTQTDARNITATTTYEPANMPVTKTSTKTSAPYEWTTSAQYAPYWGAPTTATDMLGGVTTTDYDALGRASDVWALGWPKAGHETTPSRSFDYTFAQGRNNYPSVQSQTLNAAGTYTVGYAIYDGLLRPRQSQSRATDGTNRIVSDTLYDEYGRASTAYAPHPETGAPSGALFFTPEWSLRQVVQRTEFDLAGRPTAAVTMSGDGVTNLVERWRTTTAYEGDLTKVTPPDGGVPTTTVTDAQGRVRQLRVHSTAAGVGGAYDATTYTYNRKNQLTETVDPEGNTWATTYDILGRATKRTDPDKGPSSFTYNEFDDVLTTTDARGTSLFTRYDPLGRRTGLFEGTSAAGTLRAEWKYDALYTGQPYKGQLTQSIRYDNGQAYKQQLRSFDARHQPLGYNYIIPDAEPGLAGTYLIGADYSPFDGSPNSVLYPAAGGLPTEQVVTRFDAANGLPLTLDTNLPTVTSYVTLQEYTKLGEPTVTFRKINGGEYVQSDTEYDLYTRRVARQAVKPELAAGPVFDRRYEQDPAGNILSLTDTPAVGDDEKQCFSYDGLARLASAWTPSTTASCKTAASLGALAGPAPYWTDWTFDKLGNRRTETSHAVSGNTVRTYAYPEPGENVVRPHAVTAVKTSVGGTDVTMGFAYDKAGNLSSRPVESRTQDLTWDAENELTKIVDEGKTTGNLYDANGERLIRRDSTGTTLFLPGMEIKRPTGATSNTATRYYSFAGQMIASRSTATGLDWVFTDHQGTQLTTVNDQTQKATTRRQTPYGAPRGVQASPWVNSTGFVGGTIEPDGLTHLGAREYDPELGRFISVDPLMDLADPQQWNGYAYANNSPITSSDPSGLIPSDCREFDCYGYSPGRPEDGTGGCPGGCGTEANKKWGKRNHVSSSAPNKAHKRYSGRTREGQPYPDKAKGETWTPEYFAEFTYNQSYGDALLNHAVLTDMCAATGDGCGGLSGGSNGVNWDAVKELLGVDDYEECADGSGMACGSLALNVLTSGKLKNVSGAVDAALSGMRKACSFTGETQVLMGDGSLKPISEVKPGDEVMAVDPETGERGPRRVTHTVVHQDDVVDLEMDNKSIVATTEDHPFWNATDGQWQQVQELDSGDRLLSVGSRGVRANGIVPGTVRRAAAFDLTVAGIHTYFVIADRTAVLVHNCPPGRLSDPLPNGLSRKHVNAYEDIRAGNGVPQIDPKTGQQAVFQGRGAHEKRWAGALEYRVPGTKGDQARILAKTLSDGRQVMGWTNNHYENIHPFVAPHFPDAGW